ncbi:hypothetical protein [Alcanivorax sp.]|uniref:hypothetical protein n=1 Tax=Alcanivorax sp. TaxID=1872427 RepID=UPI0025C4EEE2|nr:hypothetical protein [Alcanivorax sp.]
MKKLFALLIIIITFSPSLSFADPSVEDSCVDLVMSYSEKDRNTLSTILMKSIKDEQHQQCVKHITKNSTVLKFFGYFNGDVIENILSMFGVDYKSNEKREVTNLLKTTVGIFIYTMVLMFIYQKFEIINQYSKGTIRGNKKNIHTIICLLGGVILLLPIGGDFLVQYIIVASIVFMCIVFSWIHLLFLIAYAVTLPQIDTLTSDKLSSIFKENYVESEFIASSLVQQHLCDLSRREVELNKSFNENAVFTDNKFNDCLKSKKLSEPVGGRLFFDDYYNQLNFLNSASFESKELQLTRFCSQENDTTNSATAFIALNTQCGSIRFQKTEYATEANISAVNQKAREVASQIRAETCNFTDDEKNNEFICADLSKNGFAEISEKGPVTYKNALPKAKRSYEQLITLIDSYSLSLSEDSKEYHRYLIKKLLKDFLNVSDLPTSVFNAMSFAKDNIEEETFKDAYIGDSEIQLANDLTAEVYNQSLSFADFLKLKTTAFNIDETIKNLTAIEIMFVAREYGSDFLYMAGLMEYLENNIDKKIEDGEATKRDKALSVTYNAFGDYFLLISVVSIIIGYLIPMLIKVFFIMVIISLLVSGFFTILFSPALAFLFFNAISDENASPGTTLLKITVNYPLRAMTTMIGFIISIVLAVVIPSFVVTEYYDVISNTIDTPISIVSSFATLVLIIAIMIWSVMKSFKFMKTINKSVDKIQSLESVNDSNAHKITELLFLIFKKPLAGGLFGRRRSMVKDKNKEGE